MPEKTTQFFIQKADIEGLLVIEIDLLKDSRGFFQEKYQKEKLIAAGFPKDFNVIQQNITLNKKGVTRGIHAEPWEKYVSVIAGKAYTVFVDLRAGKDFKKKVEIELTPEKAVFVPRGVGNSFQALDDGTYYQYFVNEHWSPNGKYIAVNLADPDLAIKWPIPLNQAIISEKDKKHPYLKDLK